MFDEAFTELVVGLGLRSLLLIHTLQVLVDVLDVHGDVAYAQHDKTTISFDAEMATLSELVIETKQAVAGRIKMARILENVEANQITAQE